MEDQWKRDVVKCQRNNVKKNVAKEQNVMRMESVAAKMRKWHFLIVAKKIAVIMGDIVARKKGDVNVSVDKEDFQSVEKAVNILVASVLGAIRGSGAVDVYGAEASQTVVQKNVMVNGVPGTRGAVSTENAPVLQLELEGVTILPQEEVAFVLARDLKLGRGLIAVVQHKVLC